MEPNKLEQEIREKLGSRTISPSPRAWDRLDAMLTVAEEGSQKPAKKRGFGWLYMAASFLLMLSVGGYLLLHNQEDVEIETTKGVTTTPETKETEGYTNTGTAIAPQIQQHNAIQTAGVQKGSSSSLSKNNQQQYQTAGTAVQYISPGFDPATPVQPEMVAQKTPATKVKVDANALLASVQTKKTQAAKATQPAVKVDANALLTGIDQDMETNFRDRMVNKLVNGYDEVKEAVVTRNHN